MLILGVVFWLNVVLFEEDGVVVEVLVVIIFLLLMGFVVIFWLFCVFNFDEFVLLGELVCWVMLL